MSLDKSPSTLLVSNVTSSGLRRLKTKTTTPAAGILDQLMRIKSSKCNKIKYMLHFIGGYTYRQSPCEQTTASNQVSDESFTEQIKSLKSEYARAPLWWSSPFWNLPYAREVRQLTVCALLSLSLFIRLIQLTRERERERKSRVRNDNYYSTRTRVAYIYIFESYNREYKSAEP